MAWQHPAAAAHQCVRWLRPDAARWVRPDAAKFLKPGTDPADVYPALAQERDRKWRHEECAFKQALVHERRGLESLRAELADIDADLKRERLKSKADRAFDRVMTALHQLKYSASQPRVPAGNGRPSGQWTSGSYGTGARPRVVIDTTEWGDDAGAAAGDDAAGVDSAYDGADNNPGFDAPDESYLADDGSLPVADLRPVSEDASESDRSSEQDRPYDTRLASNEDKPRLGSSSRVAIIAEIGRG